MPTFYIDFVRQDGSIRERLSFIGDLGTVCVKVFTIASDISSAEWPADDDTRRLDVYEGRSRVIAISVAPGVSLTDVSGQQSSSKA